MLCCADEAALCWSCEEKVHAANKLASEHQRVPLLTSGSQMRKCDICQEAAGYFFCLEDRALLCRKCDVAIHTVNSLVSSHQRFLLTGVKVGLEAADLGASSSTGKSISTERILEPEKPHSVPASQLNKVMPVEGSDFAPSKMSFTGDNDSSKWEARRVRWVTDLEGASDALLFLAFKWRLRLL